MEDETNSLDGQPASHDRSLYLLAEQAVAQVYDLKGALHPLPGELDHNFRLHVAPTETYILKIMRPDCAETLVAMQCEILEHLHREAPDLVTQRVVRTAEGELFTYIEDSEAGSRIVWMLEYIDGRLWAETRPVTLHLLESLGRNLAMLDHALRDFRHAGLDRGLKWDLRNAAWLKDRLAFLKDAEDQAMVAEVVAEYKALRSRLDVLPMAAIHGDANDYNLVVGPGQDCQKSLAAIIDFGDAVRSNRICEVAVAAAYALFDADDPLISLTALVTAYHRVLPILEDEVEVIFPLIKTRLAITLTNAAIEKKEKPEDPYVVISEAPARALLRRLQAYDALHVNTTLKVACGLNALPEADRVLAWLQERGRRFADIVGTREALRLAPVVDLDVGSLANDPFEHDPGALQRAVETAETRAQSDLAIGRYGEYRLIYTENFFTEGAWPTARRRSFHLGLDIFAPAATPVRAPLDGVVRLVANNPRRQDYGPHLALEHETDEGKSFYTLYGHLATDSLLKRFAGETIAAGQQIAAIGSSKENGEWPPHLHLQLLLAVPAGGLAAPGAVYPSDAPVWSRICPNPAVLIGLEDEAVSACSKSKAALLGRRNRLLGQNLMLSYSDPLHLVRGFKQYLFDDQGRCYLDVYNNVPHVGHCHPRVVEATYRQMQLLNTNTRYLHENILAYAERLTAKLPARLSVCYFLNSASEANELALRLCRAHTGARDVIVMDTAYHGHTTSLIDISPYKFDKPGGSGPPDWVHKTPTADPYRGPHRYDDPDAGAKYARYVAEAIADIESRGRKLAAYICETLPSVGGQIIPPDGFLKAAFAHVRDAGGLCIADEVQAGFGRVGSHFWAFEMQGAEPDILVLGKPIGGGHPLAAVVTTPEIAKSFANGIEFFSTFGGNTVSCAAGLAVLDVLEDEGLQQHAQSVGESLLRELAALKKQHPAIGDVRGAGLFLGVELVRDRVDLTPAEAQASYVKNRLREKGVLLGTEGPFDNVLKIRPPMVFSQDNAEMLVGVLDTVLREDGARVD